MISFVSFDHLLSSPPDALDCAFRRLDADISLEAQVPLSSDLMRGTAVQVIRNASRCVGVVNFTQC